MFRCKECQAEYEVKPDYCDCGNDTFDEILPQKAVEQMAKPKITKKSLTPKEKVRKHISSGVDAYAIIIFALCVLLSFVVIFFVGNPKPEEQTKVSKETSVQKNIPSIDTFWDNTPVKAVEETPAEQIKDIVENIIPKVVPPEPKPVQKPAQTKSVQQKPVQKPVQQKTVQQKQAQKPAVQTQTTPKNNIQLPKSVTDITNKPVQQAVNKPQAQTVKTQTTAPVVKKLDQTEYARYKNSLMTKIASKINFAGVIGDGSCTVSFSMSSNGALINRKFERQSDNSTLNDAVYHAVMQTPTFSPPPAGYKGETIRLNVKMFNGTFEVAIN